MAFCPNPGTFKYLDNSSPELLAATSLTPSGCLCRLPLVYGRTSRDIQALKSPAISTSSPPVRSAAISAWADANRSLAVCFAVALSLPTPWWAAEPSGARSSSRAGVLPPKAVMRSQFTKFVTRYSSAEPYSPPPPPHYCHPPAPSALHPPLLHRPLSSLARLPLQQPLCACRPLPPPSAASNPPGTGPGPDQQPVGLQSRQRPPPPPRPPTG